jgi:hypothetical protein
LKSRSLAERLMDLFIARTDIFGIETQSGWRTERGKLTLEHVEKHLKGEFTLGVYPFSGKGVIKWLLADIDYKGGETIYAYMCKKFGENSIILADTGGKGTHCYALLQPTPLWQIANEINEIEKDLGVRIFPKQRQWQEKTTGNFARLILGKHHKTGNWSKIIKGDIWKVKPYVTCQHRIYDQFGDGNCTYYDGTIGYCQQDLCPKMERAKEKFQGTFEGFEADMFASLRGLNREMCQLLIDWKM